MAVKLHISTDPIPDADRNVGLVPREFSYKSTHWSDRHGTKITHIVIHIVGGKSHDSNFYEGAYSRFYLSSDQASSHYLITKEGTICQFVPDKYQSWHAGITAFEARAYAEGFDHWGRFMLRDTGAGLVGKGAAAKERRVEADHHVYGVRDDIWEEYKFWTKRYGRRRFPVNFENSHYPNAYSIGIELCNVGCGQEEHKDDRNMQFDEGVYTGLDRLLTDLCERHHIPRTREFIVGHEDVNPIARAGWDPGWAFNWNRVCDRPRFVFPLSTGEPVPPAAQYLANEDPDTGDGGTFALGSNRIVHGGIHLFPARSDTLARCMAPGYVVAARLPPRDTPPTSPKVLGLVNNWTGFVLVRHEVEEQPAAASGAPAPASSSSSSAAAPLVVYSLYMHLAPPKYEDLERDAEEYIKSVPWFQSLVRRRYGSWTCAGLEGDPPPGTMFWSREPFSGFDRDYSVYEQKEKIHPRRADGKARWIFKPPPLDFKKVVAHLESGEVVTFPEPFLTIGTAGEAIGILRRLDKDLKREAPVGFKPEDISRSGFLHWEVFAPAQGTTSDVGKLLKLISKRMPGELQNLFANPPVQESTQDNFWQISDLRANLLPKLSAGERALLDPGIAVVAAEEQKPHPSAEIVLNGHKEALQSTLRDAATFAPQAQYDGNNPGVSGYTYPLKLEIESDLVPPPNQNARGAAGYDVDIEYLKLEKIGSGTTKSVVGKDHVTIDQAKFRETTPANALDPRTLELMLKAPALANAVSIRGRSARLNVVPADRLSSDDGALLLNGLLQSRFRAARLIHMNEWSPAGATLFDTLKSLKIFDSAFVVNDVLPLTWWHPNGAVKTARVPLSQYQTAAPDVEFSGFVLPAGHDPTPINRTDSLFGTGTGQLPVDATIDNLHPVTLLWLLEILSKRGIVKVKSSWDIKTFRNPRDPPLAWGLLSARKPEQLVLGDTVQAIVIDDDYGYDTTNATTLLIELETGERLPLAHCRYQPNGFILQPVVIDFWGSSTMLVADAPRAPADPANVLNTTTLTIAPPSFDPATDEEKATHTFRPFETAEEWVMPVKLSPSAAPPLAVAGVVGIELQEGGQWKDASVGGKRIFVRALARRTIPGDQLEIPENHFVIKNGFVVGVTTSGRLQKTLAFSPRLAYEVLRQVQSRAELVVAASLAVGVQELRDALERPVTVSELSRDGRGCVLFSPKRCYRIAWLACQNSRFSAVRVPGDPTSLSGLPESPADHDLERKLGALGVEVEVGSLETRHDLLGQPHRLRAGAPSPLAPNPAATASKWARSLDPDSLVMTGDDLHITRTGPAALTRKTGGRITESFTLEAYTDVAALTISQRLLSGLDELARKVRYRVTFLDHGGAYCRVEGDVAKAAREIPAFATVDEKDKKFVTLYVPSQDMLHASFKPQGALDDLYAERMKGATPPESTPYRFYFRAVNTLNELDPELPPHAAPQRGYIVESSVPGLAKAPPASLIFRGADEQSGSLRKLAFAEPVAKLIENQLQVSCQLSGNRSGWAPFQVRITWMNGPKPPSATRDVHRGDELVTASFPIPRNATGDQDVRIEAITRGDPAAVPYPKPAPNKTTVKMTPRLGALTITPYEKYVLIQCACEGLEAASQDAAVPTAVLDLDDIKKLRKVAPQTNGRILYLQLAPAAVADGHRVRYLLQTTDVAGNSCGLPNHDGVFCAFILRNRGPRPKQYPVTLKRVGDVRGVTASLNASSSYE
jgi:N-acetyl-anhydromuramyl-L-alanine amidase AmpD